LTHHRRRRIDRQDGGANRRWNARSLEHANGEEALMTTVGRRLVVIAMPLALFIGVETARAEQDMAWDGAWTGRLGKMSTISVTIAKNKVVKYLFMGAPMPIQYSRVDAGKISFGDRDHYNMTLAKTGAATASALYHGRNGDASAALVKQ
jgi:hypothetical protein